MIKLHAKLAHNLRRTL